MRRSAIAGLIAVACSAGGGAGSAQNAAPTLTFAAGCASGPRIRIAAVGDLLFHDALQRQALVPGGSFRRFWAPVQGILDQADIVYGNFEGPAADGVTAGGGAVRDPGRTFDRRVYGMTPGALVFNFHPSVIDDLKASRFTVVSTANNHATDRGSLGIDRTIDNLRRAGVAFTGTRKRGDTTSPWSVTTIAKGLTVAWLACTYSTNGIPDRHGQVLNCYGQRDLVMAELQRLAADPEIDAVVLTPHWGQEYAHQPLASDRTYAREALEAGADAVLGAHPHVLQPWEKHRTGDGREGLIVYSLGNFISNQQKPAQRSGIIALLEFTKPEGQRRASLSAAGFVPTWVDFAGGHRVTELLGEAADKASPLAQTLRLLPRGNRVTRTSLGSLPRACTPDLIARGPQAPVAIAKSSGGGSVQHIALAGPVTVAAAPVASLPLLPVPPPEPEAEPEFEPASLAATAESQATVAGLVGLVMATLPPRPGPPVPRGPDSRPSALPVRAWDGHAEAVGPSA